MAFWNNTHMTHREFGPFPGCEATVYFLYDLSQTIQTTKKLETTSYLHPSKIPIVRHMETNQPVFFLVESVYSLEFRKTIRCSKNLKTGRCTLDPPLLGTQTLPSVELYQESANIACWVEYSPAFSIYFTFVYL
jgi:hypothetical protein